ncbi:MAG TPA: methylated-DNA--[protein]-cysteine S-methyltransferase, partial [Candidatus Sumerlaeota bacterium]|nr:methylated-DNA--[protein]-cysteine S-methyltransferase [Candidatus Sumerlaeota bacterium]
MLSEQMSPVFSFKTEWGWCAAQVSVEGIRRFALPMSSPTEVVEVLKGREKVSSGRSVFEPHCTGCGGTGGEEGRLTQLSNRLIDEVRAYFEGRLRTFSVPLDLAGASDFRRRVWEALIEISFGQTVTYGELARQVGGSARAIGGAVGANPLPLLVTCHRVLAAG